MCGERGEHTPGNPTVAVGLAIAEHGVRFVHYHDHRAKSTNSHQHAGLLPLCITDPFGAKLAHFHHRQSAFARETIDEK